MTRGSSLLSIEVYIMTTLGKGEEMFESIFKPKLLQYL